MAMTAGGWSGTTAQADTLGALTRAQMAQRRMAASIKAGGAALRGTTTLPKGSGESAEDETEVFYPVIIKSKEGTELPDYVNVMHRRGRLVLAMVPEERLTELGGYAGVERIEANMTASVNLVDAVRFCHAGEIMAGGGNTTQSGELTGRGVVTGLCDTGIDPHHAVFLDDRGKSRFGKVVTWELYAAEPERMEGAEAVGEFVTDNPDQTHATHVAAIMGGNGGGTSYRGLAPESEMVVSAGPLADAFLLTGCEETIAYARERGMPAVVNMSISSTVGPHDGTTLFNQYMAEICREATVCISAGNDGARRGYAAKTLRGDGDYMRTYVREYPGWSAIRVDGITDVWGEAGKRFKADIVCTDFNSDEVLFRYRAVDLEAGQTGILLTSGGAEGYPAERTEPLQEGIEGYIHAVGEINPENGRMNVAVTFNYADTRAASSRDARYTYGIEITGGEGNRIEAYASEGVFFHGHWDRTATGGDASRSVNDFCTGEGPVCVGAMVSQNRNQNIAGEWVDYSNLTVGDVAYFSSYGTLDDGSVLPHVVAPGAQTISAMSTPYMTGGDGRIFSDGAFASVREGKEYYWGSMQGTSMSAPFAAGVFALWLEEDPTLTPAEIKRIATETADAPAVNAENPQWGLGILNAARGLAAVRDRAGTGNVRADGEGRLTATGWGRYRVTGLGEGEARVSVYGLTGMTVKEARGSGEGMEVSLEGLEPGVYVIVCEGEKGQVRRKVTTGG